LWGHSIAEVSIETIISILIGINEDWIVGNTYNNNKTVLKKEDWRTWSILYKKLGMLLILSFFTSLPIFSSLNIISASI
jgi:hypothetical protein